MAIKLRSNYRSISPLPILTKILLSLLSSYANKIMRDNHVGLELIDFLHCSPLGEGLGVD
jgi:hypothetical protein